MSTKTKGLQIATRCASVDEFVTRFHRNVRDDSIFVATNTSRPAGLETAFAFVLADNTPALRGLALITQSWSSGENEFGKPGILLSIQSLTSDSAHVLERMQNAQAKPAPKPEPEPKPEPPAKPPAKPVEPAKPAAPEVKRRPGSKIVLPANPLSNINDNSLDVFVDYALLDQTIQLATDMFDLGDVHPIRVVTPPAGLPVVAAAVALPPPPTGPLPLLPSAPSSPWRSRVAIIAGATATVMIGIGIIIAATRKPPAAAKPIDAGSPVAVAPPPMCSLAFETTPSGAAVSLDGKSTGVSPAKLTAPCGPHQLAAKLDRYAPIDQQVVLAPDKPTLALALARPAHLLAITTEPSGAAIWLGEEHVGVSPATISIPGFTSIVLRFDKPGYKPVFRKLTSEQPNDKLALKLSR